jgi:predicted metalloprotease with PDZ domain
MMLFWTKFPRAVPRSIMVAGLTVAFQTAIHAKLHITNTVTLAAPASTSLHVTTVITGVSQPELVVGLPNWTPGYYTTEDFVRNVSRLTFKDQTGRSLNHRKSHDSFWNLNTRGATSVTIDFDDATTDLDLNRTWISPAYGLLNGTNFLFYVQNHTLDVPESLTVKLPQGWSIATGLASTADPSTFEAENYDVLVDCPLVVGQFDRVTLPLRNVPHHLVVAPKGLIAEADLNRLAANYLKIIDAQIGVFGEVPYKQYLTINIFEDRARNNGGLEHLNCFVGILPKLAATPAALPGLGGLTAHEFFHAFNVKRIRPAEMWPYRYETRNYTPLLWVSEGITDYYTSRGLLRAGFTSQDGYLRQEGQLLGAVQSVEAAKYISVEEASINTWIGGLAGGSQPFAVDYYSRGDVLGLLLDLSIRRDTHGKSTLDDLMRYLYANYYKKNRGFTTADLISAIEKLSGKDYHRFFESYVSGTEPLPYDQVLAGAGLKLDEKKTKVARLGVATATDNRITFLTPGGAMDAAGAHVGDVLLSIGDLKTSDATWADQFRRAYANKDGEALPVTVSREGKELALNGKVKLVDQSGWNLEKIDSAGKDQQELRDKWLEGK